MSAFLKLKLATAVINAVLRDAQCETLELGSDEDVLVVKWLHDEPGLAGAELAWRCGRSRSNMHRTLKRLQAKGIVEPRTSAFSGKVCGWQLTRLGAGVHDDLSRRLILWDMKLHAAASDIDVLAERLHKVMSALLRPFDQRAPGERLMRPERADKMPEWNW